MNWTIRHVFLLLLLSGAFGCNERQEVVFEAEGEKLLKPDTVHFYIDASQSIKGFFNGQSDLIRLIGNVNTELIKKDIGVVFHRFSNDVKYITHDYKEFSKIALSHTYKDDKGQEVSFYNEASNVYSKPLASVLKAMQQDSSGVHLILSDAVISTPKPEQERSDIQVVLAHYAKQENSTVGLFQYFYAFKGTYYAQPFDAHIYNVDAKRNFYVMALMDKQFVPFLNDLFIEKNPANTYQYFKNSFESFISVEPIDKKTATIITDNKFRLKMRVDSVATGYNSATLAPLLRFFDDQGKRLEDVMVTIVDTLPSTTYILEIANPREWPAMAYLKIAAPPKAKSVWRNLYYLDDKGEPISAEPTDHSIDHTKTYSLDILIKAMEYVYNDAEVFSYPIRINKYKSSPFGAIYSMGGWLQQSNPAWQGIYTKAFWIALILPAIFFALLLYFVVGGFILDWASENGHYTWTEPTNLRLAFWGAALISTALASFLIALPVLANIGAVLVLIVVNLVGCSLLHFLVSVICRIFTRFYELK